MVEVPGVAVREEVGAEVEDKVKLDSLDHPNAGPTSRRVLTIRHLECARSITFMGNLHTGAKSQGLVPGKSSGSLRVSNETVTSLILTTYKTHCIMV